MICYLVKQTLNTLLSLSNSLLLRFKIQKYEQLCTTSLCRYNQLFYQLSLLSLTLSLCCSFSIHCSCSIQTALQTSQSTEIRSIMCWNKKNFWVSNSTSLTLFRLSLKIFYSSISWQWLFLIYVRKETSFY